MREEYKGSNIGAQVQHSHDFFVISSCKITATLTREGNDDNMVKLRLLEAPKSLLPGDVDAAKDILNRYGLDLNSVATRSAGRKISFPPQGKAQYRDANLSKTDNQNCKKLFDFIEDKKEMGASSEMIKDLKLSASKMTVDQYVKILLEESLILKTGVVTARFVSNSFSSPWLLHSFRKTLNPKTEAQKEQSSSKELPEKRPRTRPKSKEEKDEGRYLEDVHVLLRPWIRIDGTLNRRVLDRLLGAVLGQVMQRPGQLVTSVCNSISPALQPMHTMELVDILVELRCITVSKLVKKGRPALFSKPVRAEVTEATLLDSPTETFVEATVDAVVRLGQFIGDKQYGLDFVYQCSCHPDRSL